MALAQLKTDDREDSMPQQRINSANKRLSQAFDRLERAVKIHRLRGIALTAEKEKLQAMLSDLQQQYNTLQATADQINEKLEHSLAAIESELRD